MLHLSAHCRYFLFQGHADMRKGFDSLSGLVNTVMKQKVLSGDIYIFVNRKRTHIKLLHWEGDGYGLYYKRLEKGSYELPVKGSENGSIALTHEQLLLIMQGISLQHIRKRKRYQHVA